MRNHLAVAAAAAVLMSSGPAVCQPRDEAVPEVVVTATRLETPVEEVSGTILVIPAAEIEEKQAVTVADALRGVPGISLVSQGGQGKTSSVLMRGGEARFTLVMIDGVQVNDPGNPERTFDFAHLPAKNIERIEILFGPQSTLYGSDAIGGVINIITKKGRGPVSFTAEAETGSFETARAHAAWRGDTGIASWYLSADHLDSEGISAASGADGNTERDGYENLSMAGNVEIALGKTSTVVLDVLAVGPEREVDYAGGPGGDDPNFSEDADHYLLSARLSAFPADIWELTSGVSRNVHERHYRNEPDANRPFTMELEYRGASEKVELVNNFYLNDRTTLTLGADSEKETGESSFFSDEFGPYTSVVPEQSARVDGIFVQDQYTAPSGLAFTLGARSDDHSDFGRETTYRAGVSVPLSSDLRFRTVFGTGFRAPSIDQLFNPDYGNPDLGAERSRGWDAGLEASLGKRTTAALAWHLTKYDDLIAWFDADGDPSTWWDGSYENIAAAETEGVDLSVEAVLGALSLEMNGSWLRTEDDQGEELLRRPRRRAAARAGYEPAESVALSAEAVYVGKRKDWGGATLGQYTLVNLTGSYRFSGRVKFFGRVRNLTDEQYEEAGGYGTPGRAVYAGVRVQL